MRIGRSCVICGHRTTGDSRCAAHAITLTHQDRQYQANRQLAMLRDQSTCTACGAHGIGVHLQVDHITELRDGGTHDLANLRVLCAPCHEQKTHDR